MPVQRSAPDGAGASFSRRVGRERGKVKRLSPGLLDPIEGQAGNMEHGNWLCDPGICWAERGKVNDADCRQNGSQSGDDHQSGQRYEKVRQASVFRRSHCRNLS